MVSPEVVTMDLASSAQLEMIDKLRALGISSFVALPQLAVVGDQSSGKSSVLESFSELPFPRDSLLCTRFATQIIFRRDPAKSITVSIIPGPDRSKQEIEKLRGYVKKGLETLSSSEFLLILNDVCKAMGIPGPGQPLEIGQSTFSDDLLSIELCGPDKQNLSIIDIPGIFRTPTEGLTTNDDMALVRKIMYRHIRDERTIILAVIPSNTDVAIQEILSIAKEVDPKGLRTLGVLTKPDLVDKGAEETVMSLVQGQRHPLRLGYCIVRNRGQSELWFDSVARYQTEKIFFSTEPWAQLSRDRVGTKALQCRLQDLLIDITRREFPKVQNQIVQQLSSCRKRLAALGVDRQSTDQQRRYLLEMSREFQEITNFTLDAYYSRHVVFANGPELKLATLCVDRNDEFSNEVLTLGHSIPFESNEDETEEEAAPSLAAGSDNEAAYSDEDENDDRAVYAELYDLIPDLEDVKPTEGDIMDWIREEYKKARGFALGTIGPSIMPTIWQEQSKNWETLTMAYIRDIIFYVHDFICRVLTHVCPDERVRSGLWSSLQELLLDRYEKAIAHVKFIVKVERLARRLKGVLEDHLKSTADTNANRVPSVGRTSIIAWEIQEAIAMSNADHEIQHIHDILQSYYKVARKRFVDTVCMQGSDFHLLTGDISPLRIFGTSFVSGLSAAQLNIIAGEEASVKQLRASLTKEIASLEEGKKLLRA